MRYDHGGEIPGGGEDLGMRCEYSYIRSGGRAGAPGYNLQFLGASSCVVQTACEF